MLLSATAGDPNGTTIPERVVATKICFLPWQTHIYVWYVMKDLCKFSAIFAYKLYLFKQIPYLLTMLLKDRSLCST